MTLKAFTVMFSHMLELVGIVLISLLCGTLLGHIIYATMKRQEINAARREAQEILLDAKGETEDLLEAKKEEFVDIEAQLRSQYEDDFVKAEERIDELEDRLREKQSRFDQSFHQTKSRTDDFHSKIQTAESQIQKREDILSSWKHKLQETSKRMIQVSLERLQLQENKILEELTQNLIEQAQRRSEKSLEDEVSLVKSHSEFYGKRILALAIDRFARPYCPERGIGLIHFPNAQSRKNFTAQKDINVQAVQEYCGCDIVILEDDDQVGIAGYDPVRRELTRRVLTKLFGEKRAITADLIKKTAQVEFKKLFRSIETDGNQLAQELKLQNLHPEVRQMMGALRYRYSFTQNQYFHCGEVGWLTGLLASELGHSTLKGRRCGMLHDLGKSMDHAIDGGHAVIGANFIEARGELPEIVHAVRAHHYDVTPDSDLAFLVIAADAISGARPGARRSTVESYNQKVTALQDIAKKHPGVTDCIILNGGRECRLTVDSRHVSDLDALQLSKKIARQVEEECNYPGQIKVVVVRETHVSENIRKEYA